MDNWAIEQGGLSIDSRNHTFRRERTRNRFAHRCVHKVPRPAKERDKSNVRIIFLYI